MEKYTEYMESQLDLNNASFFMQDHSCNSAEIFNNKNVRADFVQVISKKYRTAKKEKTDTK